MVDQVEDIARQPCAALRSGVGQCAPHSGASAHSAVMLAVLKPGDKIVGFDLAHGGHLTHGSPVNYRGSSTMRCSTAWRKRPAPSTWTRWPRPLNAKSCHLWGFCLQPRLGLQALPGDRRQCRCLAPRGHQPPVRPHRHGPSQRSAAPLPHRDVHHAQDPARSARRHHHGGPRHGQSVGPHHTKRGGPQAVFAAGQRGVPGHAGRTARARHAGKAGVWRGPRAGLHRLH